MQFLEAACGIGKRNSEPRSAYSRLRNRLIFWQPFGCEYAQSPRWKPLERAYIRVFGLVDLPTRMRARLIAKTLRGIPWKTMLDFGSGTGAYSFYFSRSRGVQVSGVDILKTRIEECIALRQLLEGRSLDFITSSRIFETDRFQPNSINVVLAIEVLPYLFDVRAGFQDIQQVLTPGGYMIGHVPLLGYGQKPETIRFDAETIARFVKESGLQLLSITRVFGRTARFLSRIYAYCVRSRFCTALAFPLLLTASFACGGTNSNGSYCLVIARKPPRQDAISDPLLQKRPSPPNVQPTL
jgi:SAM-dependent methyltransferase